MSRALHLLSLLLVLLVPTALLGACGGDDSSGEDVNAVLQETFDGTGKAVESGKLDLSLKLDLEGAGKNLEDPIAIALSGPFENQGDGKVPRFDFSLNLDGGGQQFQAGAISTGSAAYLVFSDQAYAVDKATFEEFEQGYVKAQKEDGGKRDSGPSLAALGVDPRRWLKNPEEVGTEEVGGVETIHLTAEVDVPRLLEDVNRLVKSAGNLGVGDRVPDELTASERARAAEALKTVKVDIWTGAEDKTLRKLALALVISVPENERKQAGLAGGKVDLEYAIGDLNKPQTVEEPANARPVSELNAALAALGLGGGGSGSAPKGQTSTTPQQGTATTASPSQAYLDCLEAAGEDPAKVSGCSKLLTQP